MSSLEKFTVPRSRFSCVMTWATYSRTRSGKSWKRTPDAVRSEEFTPAEYQLYIRSVPFFNAWGKGAYCRAHSNDTCIGHIPVTVVTVAPGRQTKTVTRFTFDVPEEA